MKRFAIAVAITAGLGGCAGSPIGEHSTLVPGTMAIRAFGNNYSILALVETSGERVPMRVFAADCERKRGGIRAADGLDIYERDARLNGPAPKDKLFTQLCNKGRTVPAAIVEAKMTPDQSEQR